MSPAALNYYHRRRPVNPMGLDFLADMWHNRAIDRGTVLDDTGRACQALRGFT